MNGKQHVINVTKDIEMENNYKITFNFTNDSDVELKVTEEDLKRVIDKINDTRMNSPLWIGNNIINLNLVFSVTWEKLQ